VVLSSNLSRPIHNSQRKIKFSTRNTSNYFYYPKSLNISCYFKITTFNKGGLKVKKEFFIVLMIVSIFLISACDVYNTLYIKEVEDVVEVPEGDMIIEGLDKEEVDTEEVEAVDAEDVIEEEDVEEEKVIVVEEIEIDIEEKEEKEIPEDAPVIMVEETELVSLVTKAEDPDKDILTFTFTSPIDENGEWKTSYGDSGEYTVTVTASDGTLTASKEVLIIVNRKEEAPIFESFKPQEKTIEIDETDTVAFEIVASDLNNDVLKYLWKIDGIEVGDRNSYNYKTTYDDSGSHTVKVAVSDGIFDTEKLWSTTINNLNRKPLIEDLSDITVRETDSVVIELIANDEDGDKLSYEIDNGRFVQDENSFTWETAYDDAGKYVVTVSVSDGVDTVSQEVTVTVENVNRAPIILDIIQK
tara:strand:- start:1962 stop:3200 length:1239 start_codon:yes stop_codon:yes gene_type:complete